ISQVTMTGPSTLIIGKKNKRKGGNAMFGHILNPFLKTRKEIKNQNGQYVDEKIPSERLHVVELNNRDLTNGDIILFETENKKIIIDSFELGVTGHPSAIYPRYYQSLNDNAPNVLKGVKGSTTYALTHLYVEKYGSSMFESIQYDIDNGYYKIVNKGPLIFPQGGRFLIHGGNYYDSNSVRYYCVIYYREIEVL